MLDLSEKPFLEIFEELDKTRWAFTSQPELDKPDWSQYCTIG